MVSEETGGTGSPGKVFGFEDEEQMAALKEIKVKLPVSQHIKLHSLKITRNKSISDVVAQALEDYFSKLEKEPSSDDD